VIYVPILPLTSTMAGSLALLVDGSLSQMLGLGTLLVVCFVLPYSVGWLQNGWKKLRLQLKRRAQGKSKAILNDEPVQSPEVSKAGDFPDDWWTSEKLYQLEKRAIFSKVSHSQRSLIKSTMLTKAQTWLHVCHSSLNPKAGDFRSFTFADFSFLVIRGKDGQLRAFHNLCRHRAYNVTNKAAGNAGMLMCKYHGWTYDNQGKLVKAPKFDDLSGFDKSQNGLFEIRTFIDSSGFLYANFDVYGSDGLTIRVGVPIRARLSLVESWTQEADFNWKIAVAPGAFPVRSLVSLSKIANLLSKASNVFEPWQWPSEIELSSLTRVLRSATGDLWLTISIVPLSHGTTSIQCAFYTTQPESLRSFPLDKVKAEVAEGVQSLESKYQDVKESGSVDGVPHQEALLAEIKAHSRLERLMRQEVHPASRVRETSQACKIADDLCRELEAAEGAKHPLDGVQDLAW